MRTSTFVKGLAVCIVAMIAMGVVLGLLNHGRSRPEGVAENWLTAVGDTTRKGVEVDARDRAERIGDLAFAKDLVYPNAQAIDRKSAFADLEVGKAEHFRTKQVERVAVGFRVHALRPNDRKAEITGVMTLRRDAGTWTVSGLDIGQSDAVPELPSDGGPPPSSAPLSLWLGGLVGAAVIGLVTTALVRAATP